MSNHNIEHLPISLHFVDKNHDIHKEVIGFVKIRMNWSS